MLYILTKRLCLLAFLYFSVAVDAKGVNFSSTCPQLAAESGADLVRAKATYQVWVKSGKQLPVPMGTATVIDPRGYLLTAGHIIAGVKRVILRNPAYPDEIEATVVASQVQRLASATDEPSYYPDIAILQVPRDIWQRENIADRHGLFIELAFSSMSQTRAESYAYLNSNPVEKDDESGQWKKRAENYASRLHFNATWVPGRLPYFKGDEPAAPGNSGALAYLQDGRAIGIIVEGPPMDAHTRVEPTPNGGGGIYNTDTAAKRQQYDNLKIIPFSTTWQFIREHVPLNEGLASQFKKISSGYWKLPWDELAQWLIGTGDDSYSSIDRLHLISAGFQSQSTYASLGDLGEMRAAMSTVMHYCMLVPAWSVIHRPPPQ